MDPRDLAILLSPIVAVIVAVATIAFNIFDRRRHYAIEREKLSLEREKIAREMSKALLSGARSLEKRMDLYNTLMQSVSEISAQFKLFVREIELDQSGKWDERLALDPLERLQTQVCANQIFTTRYRHESLSRGYVERIAAHARKLTQAQAQGLPVLQLLELARNTLAQVIGDGDRTKESLRDDLEQFVRGVAQLGLQPGHFSRNETKAV